MSSSLDDFKSCELCGKWYNKNYTVGLQFRVLSTKKSSRSLLVLYTGCGN